MVRDAILVVGPSAAGKTEILNELRRQARLAGIPHVYRPITDSHTILGRMAQDDRHGGFGHYHTWCPANVDGHTHENGEPTIPFTVAGNGIAHGMMEDFFNALAQAPERQGLWFAEWSGGVNTNDSRDPASLTDLSFKTIGSKLRQGEFKREGLNRVIAIIHPEITNERRFDLNASRKIPSREEIDFGTASWPLSETAMRIFGGDDFVHLLPLFQEVGIAHIHSIHNNGDELLLEHIRELVPKLFAPWLGRESEGRGGYSPEAKP